MNKYRYILEPYKGINSRYHCPGCGRSRVFTRYIDTDTGQHLPDIYGRCERLNNCGYLLDPYKDGYVNSVLADNQQARHRTKVPSNITAKSVSFISSDVFQKSQAGYEHNHFYIYLSSLFQERIATSLMHRFNIGSSRYWSGATVFWQVDTQGKIRTGKLMLYNPVTGKREKQMLPDGSTRSMINWAHNALKIEPFNLEQCLFGLQQLSQTPTNKSVAIVESEKTAIIATVYLPQFTWLACGSLTNLTKERLLPLMGRRIALFPDLGAYDRWCEKSQEIKKALSCQLTVSSLLEQRANEADKANGLDLADYLIKQDKTMTWALTDEQYPLFWDNPLALPVCDYKAHIYEQELIKYAHEPGNYNVYDLALSIGIDLQTAINICMEFGKKHRCEIT